MGALVSAYGISQMEMCAKVDIPAHKDDSCWSTTLLLFASKICTPTKQRYTDELGAPNPVNSFHSCVLR